MNSLQNEKQVQGALQNEKQVQAALKIQSIRRGAQARKYLVLPSQLTTYLKEHLLLESIGNVAIEVIARSLCLEMKEVVQNLKDYIGRSVVVEGGSKTYSFWTEGKWEKVTLPFHFKLEVPKEEKKINLLITPLKKNFVGKGSYKEFYFAQQFEIYFGTQNTKIKENSFFKKRIVKYQPRVIFFPQKKLKDSQKQQMQLGFSYHQQLYKTNTNPLKVKLVEPPKPILPKIEGCLTSIWDNKLDQSWYHSDLNKVCRLNKICKVFKPDSDPDSDLNIRSITMIDKLNVLLDVAYTLEFIHEQELVHGDVKPANILIKLKEDGSIHGFLSDFDCTSYPGENFTVPEYAYWDTITERGVITPFCDCYGLVMCMAESLLPNFQYRLHNHIYANSAGFKSKQKLAVYLKENGVIKDFIEKTFLSTVPFEKKVNHSYSKIKENASFESNNTKQPDNQKDSTSVKMNAPLQKSILEEIYITIKNEVSFLNVENIINIYLYPEPSLSEENVKILKQKKKEISVLNKMNELLKEVVKIDQKLSEHFLLPQKMTNKVINSILNEKFTINFLCKELETIRNEFLKPI